MLLQCLSFLFWYSFYICTIFLKAISISIQGNLFQGVPVLSNSISNTILYTFTPFLQSSFVSAFPDDAEGEVEDFLPELEDRGADNRDDSDLDLEEDDEGEAEGRGDEPEQPMWVVPLYSMLPPEKQQMVGYLWLFCC